MKCRTRELPSDPVPGSESAKARRLRTSSTQHGGKNSEASAETETGLEQVLEASNMQRAWQRVRRNRGAPGIDGMAIDEFPAFAREHWERISSQIKEGTYRPAPVRRVYIPKPDGSQRPLGVPTVLDRVIQQASPKCSLRSMMVSLATKVTASARVAMPIRQCVECKRVGNSTAVMPSIVISRRSSTW